MALSSYFYQCTGSADGTEFLFLSVYVRADDGEFLFLSVYGRADDGEFLLPSASCSWSDSVHCTVACQIILIYPPPPTFCKKVSLDGFF